MSLRILFLFVISVLSTIQSVPVKLSKPATCNSCHPLVNGKVNIHIVPHSHDDVGWLKTYDQYYFGSGIYNTYSDAGVQYIISSSIQALKNHPERRYIQVETAFFWKWWQNQNDLVKDDVKSLLKNGQLEIISGGWSMNDEAASHYHSLIDQFTLAFGFLNETLGECARPKFGWQVDPFGHSREHASLMSQLGFQGLLVGRIDYRDKNRRIRDKDCDFVWKASSSLESSKIFTTTYPDGYIAEGGFCFDTTCQETPINDDPESPGYNLNQKVDQYASRLDFYRNFYKTPNILMPMGGDFHFQAAEVNFANIDRLIKGFKDHPTYNVIYSTPSCYMQAVNDEVTKESIELSTKEDDFFPYGSGDHGYWTGYFTSRPTSKRDERFSNNILQGVKQLATLSKIDGKNLDDSLFTLKSAMGIMQHHDAITGTEKQAVANDYARLLRKGIEEASKPVGLTIGNLLKKSTTPSDLKLSLCLFTNVSICDVSTKDKFLVTIQNPLSRKVDHYVRLPVDGTAFKITGPDGEEPYDVLDPINDFSYIQGQTKPGSKDLVFVARNLPPLGIKVYYIEKSTGVGSYTPFQEIGATDDGSFGDENNGFSIDTKTGSLTSARLNKVKVELSQEMLYYTAFVNPGGGGNSGAYIFRPTEALPVKFSGTATFKVARGKLIDEVLQVVNGEVSQIIRVYKATKENYIEFDWLVGDLQFLQDGNGKEVINKITIKDFINDGTFFTDSNGREMLKRRLNKREDYEYDASPEPVASNYYPVTAKIVIKDKNKNLEVALLNDRAQGGSSLRNGEIEVMVHRRLSRDDSLGVDEALDEVEFDRGLYARGLHYLTFGKIEENPAAERDLATKKRLRPLLWLTAAPEFDSLKKVQDLIKFEYEGLTKSLQDNVVILTLEPRSDSTYILRLEHTLEVDEDAELSKPVTVDLENLFTSFQINDIGETTLGANQWLGDFDNEDKFIWNKNDARRKVGDDDNPLKITLNPMQIRTFVVKTVKQ